MCLNEHSVFDGVRARWSKEDIATRARLINHVQKMIGEDSSLAEIAILFCLAHPAISTVIPGHASLSQLEKNAKVVNKTISTELVDELQQFYQNEVKDLNLPW